MEKHRIYSFLGLPASGKGTQAEMFAEKRGLTRIGIGDLVRDEIKNNKEDNDFINTIKKLYSDGSPVTDDIVFKLLEKRLTEIKEGVVFDNFPFNLGQAEFLLNYAKQNDWDEPVIVYINVNPEDVIKRISSRRICPNCKAVYTGGEICEKCGTKLISRSDDNEETVRKRIGNYMPNIDQVVTKFKNEGTVYEIDGAPSIEKVQEEIESKVA
jgi:adenylate kinase